jgi:hypothetical protein
MRLVVLLLLQGGASSFTTISAPRIRALNVAAKKGFDFKHASTVLYAEDEEKEDNTARSSSFDEAGRSLVDEDDQKRMEEMGDFDSNPDVRFSYYYLCNNILLVDVTVCL